MERSTEKKSNSKIHRALLLFFFMNLLNVHCSDHRPMTHYCFLEVVWQNAGAEMKGNLLSDQSCHYNYPRLTDY